MKMLRQVRTLLLVVVMTYCYSLVFQVHLVLLLQEAQINHRMRLGQWNLRLHHLRMLKVLLDSTQWMVCRSVSCCLGLKFKFVYFYLNFQQHLSLMKFVSCLLCFMYNSMDDQNIFGLVILYRWIGNGCTTRTNTRWSILMAYAVFSIWQSPTTCCLVSFVVHDKFANIKRITHPERLFTPTIHA